MSNDKTEIEFYLSHDRICPRCHWECYTDTRGSNERDSSGDVHRCPNPECGWYVHEMSLWNYE